MPLWSAEDYSTYSDATGAGCWARLLVQNVGYGYSATISWYLIGSFTRGRHYDADGLLRAEWPSSGHWEVTPMAWMTMHWTLFAQPGWVVATCSTVQCKLAGGGDYAVLVSPDRRDVTVIIETFLHSNSRCIRQDPPDWSVVRQTVTIALPAGFGQAHRDGGVAPSLNVWKSCTGWRYPANDDSYLIKQAPLEVSSTGQVQLVAEVNCYYTLTTVTGVVKPSLPLARAEEDPRPAFFPLPFSEDFEGVTAGGEAPFFGDQEGKWETVPAGGGRSGQASQQQLRALKPWPILEPQCNDHGAPISIIGDMFFESVRVTADLLIVEHGVGVAVALRLRVSSAPKNIRGVSPGVFLYVGATPGVVQAGGHANPGGTLPAPNTHRDGWTLCADSYCNLVLKRGQLPGGANSSVVGQWHTVSLEVTDNVASGSIDSTDVFSHVWLKPSPVPSSAPTPPLPSPIVQRCINNTTLLAAGRVIAGGDYRQLVLPPPGNSTADIHACSKACCADGQCSAWAVAKGKCWLKHHGWSIRTLVGGEAACAVRPAGPPPPPPAPPLLSIPPSGWAGVAGTIGLSQVDNFKLVGTASPGGAAAAVPCQQTVPAVGSVVVSTPCDYPQARTQWETVAPGGGVIRLVPSRNGSHGSSNGDVRRPAAAATTAAAQSELCLGVSANATEADDRPLTLVLCHSNSALIYDVSTGRISPRSDASHCVTAVQRTSDDSSARQMVLSTCKAIPSETQQFQYNPGTGALRPKTSSCIATSHGESTRVQYRDCCAAVCM
jgi:hypothetical protein